MREVVTKVYAFDELSDSAKDKAREWYRIASADDFASFEADTVLDDASRLAQLFGLNIATRPVKLMNGSTRMEPNVYWSIGGRDASVSYAGYYGYRKGANRAVATEAPAKWKDSESVSNAELNRIVQELTDLQRRYFYRLQASIDHRRSPYDGISVTVEYDGSDYRELPQATIDAVTELLEDFATWIRRQLEMEYEYQQSDECVDENIHASDYEFTEDGDRA